MATALGTQVKSLEMLVAVDMKKLQSQLMCWAQSNSESTTISDSYPKGCTEYWNHVIKKDSKCADFKKKGARVCIQDLLGRVDQEITTRARACDSKHVDLSFASCKIHSYL